MNFLNPILAGPTPSYRGLQMSLKFIIFLFFNLIQGEMKKQARFFMMYFLLTVVISNHSAKSQVNYASKVEKEILSGNVMHITYEIKASDNTKFFFVILEALYDGQKISIAEAYGNVGHRQQAGKNEVVWYFKKDFEGDVSNVRLNVYAVKENEPRALAKVQSITNGGAAPCEVVFANNSQYANQYEWNFGDVESGVSNHSIEENPVHKYSKSGIYTTTLIARNTDIRMEETWVYTIEIKEPAAPVEEIKPPTIPAQPEVKEEAVKTELPAQPEVKEEAVKTEPPAEPVIKEPVIKEPDTAVQKHKTLKMVWLGSAIASAGIGGISYLQANSAYNKYTESNDNTEAVDLRKKFKSNDVIYPLAFIISGVCISQVIIQAGKQKKAQGSLGFQLVPLENGGAAVLTLNF